MRMVILQCPAHFLLPEKGLGSRTQILRAHHDVVTFLWVHDACQIPYLLNEVDGWTMTSSPATGIAFLLLP